MKHISVIFIILIICTLPYFTSCQNEARRYPSAEVTIENFYEYENPLTETKQILINCVIHNTSSVSINSGAVTLKAKTDKREYLQTITAETRIIPGGKIALNVIITYLENAEQLQAGGISVYASYFD